MLSVDEARSRMLSAAPAGRSERVAVEDCAGRVLARDIIAGRAQPPFRASAMDGYAVRAADTPGRLRVVGESAAGRSYGDALREGEAVRISTGAPVPSGADTIVIQEDARRDGDLIEAPEARAGRHIRALGSDFGAGDALLATGQVLHPGALMLAAAAGFAQLDVSAQPRVTVFSGGDEIVLPGAAATADQVFDSTRYGIAAMISAAGAAPRLTPLLPDDRAAVRAAVEPALANSDLILLIGGASVGDHDHARAALGELGVELSVEKVAVRPGKPTWFGICHSVPVLGLPGNPASALVCARLFLRPLLDKMLGRDPVSSIATRAARLNAPLKANGARETYLRARSWHDEEGQVWAETFSDQDSSLMRVFAASDCLIVRKPDEAEAAQGDLVSVLPL
jgi:molybdopterin molybdotransferase